MPLSYCTWPCPRHLPKTLYTSFACGHWIRLGVPALKYCSLWLSCWDIHHIHCWEDHWTKFTRSSHSNERKLQWETKKYLLREAQMYSSSVKKSEFASLICQNIDRLFFCGNFLCPNVCVLGLVFEENCLCFFAETRWIGKEWCIKTFTSYELP